MDNWTSKKILIVDDDESMRHLTETILSANNFSIIQAADGWQALEMLKTHKLDLIITDLMMPQLNGYELIEKIRADPETKNIPIILVTSKSDPDDISCGYHEHKVEYYITKPFSNQQLMAGIRLVLGD
ncbi:MAG: response regulator [Deltaproteobacteria bacterium]|jgi:CheY-like chemotaxis protein|nr:response regulator [Deltaproteobacteria bacterium]